MKVIRVLQVFGLTCLLLAIAYPRYASTAQADVMELKSGERVEGELKQVTATSVIVDVAGQLITFDRAKVRAFYFGPPPMSGIAPQVESSRTAIGEAIGALKAVQSAVSAGISYRDYGPRVTDAKIRVDRALEQPGWTPPVRGAVAVAMESYIHAASVWAKDLRYGFNIFQKGDALLEACPGAEAFLKERGKPEGKDSIAVDGAQSTQIFWLCASAKIAEAENLSRGD